MSMVLAIAHRFPEPAIISFMTTQTTRALAYFPADSGVRIIDVPVPSLEADEILVRGRADPAARALSETSWIRRVETPAAPRFR